MRTMKMAAVSVAANKSVRLLLPLLIAGTVAAGCGGKGEEAGEEKKEAKVMVLGAHDVALAETAPLEIGVTISGTLEPHKIVDVNAQITGKISGIWADEGSVVSQGQRLGVLEGEGLRSQLAGARSAAEAAQASLDLARQRLEATEQLFATGAVSKIERDNARNAVQGAESQLRGAQAQVSVLSEQAGRTVITSPLSGRISARYVNEGEAVTAGRQLYTVVNTAVLELKGQVASDQVGDVRVGQKVSLTLSGAPDKKIRGTVARIDPLADPQTRQVSVYVQVQNTDDALVGGQFATGTILTGGGKSGLVIPTAAVHMRGETPYAYVVERGQLVERELKLGQTNEAEGIVEVLSGIRGGEYVITTPSPSIEPGTPVRLASEEQPAAAPGSTAAGGE